MRSRANRTSTSSTCPARCCVCSFQPNKTRSGRCYRCAPVKPILSERDLACRLGFPLERLRKMAGAVHKHYREFSVKNGDKVRVIRPPLEDLKLIQRRIKANILDRVP